MELLRQLQPRRQPGRADRKAAAYAAEIKRLRVAGYTYEAIREALADVGVELSEAALRREIRRQQPDDHMHLGMSTPSATNTKASPQAPPLAAAPTHPPAVIPTGRELAAAFFEANPSNPLLRAKDNP